MQTRGELSLAKVEQEMRVLGEYITRIHHQQPRSKYTQLAENGARARLRELKRRRALLIERIEGRRAS